MLEALGIDEAAIRRAEPALLYDMERICSFCNHKRQCHRELAAGTASANYEEYCGNADTIDTRRFKSWHPVRVIGKIRLEIHEPSQSGPSMSGSGMQSAASRARSRINRSSFRGRQKVSLC